MTFMRPETMRAMVLTAFGSYDTLHYRPDIPIPRPADDEVLVKVAACGINNTDNNSCRRRKISKKRPISGNWLLSLRYAV